jgi:hypothetical protein
MASPGGSCNTCEEDLRQSLLLIVSQNLIEIAITGLGLHTQSAAYPPALGYVVQGDN